MLLLHLPSSYSSSCIMLLLLMLLLLLLLLLRPSYKVCAVYRRRVLR